MQTTKLKIAGAAAAVIAAGALFASAQGATEQPPPEQAAPSGQNGPGSRPQNAPDKPGVPGPGTSGETGQRDSQRDVAPRSDPRDGRRDMGGREGRREMGEREMGPRPDRRGPACGERIARFAQMRLARIEQLVKPTDTQRAAFEDFKAASTKAADLMKAACPAEPAMTPTGRLEAAEKRADARLQAIRAVRPALDTFYKSLTDEQKARFNALGQPGPRMAGGDWRQRWHHQWQHFGGGDRQGWRGGDDRRGPQGRRDERGFDERGFKDRGFKDRLGDQRDGFGPGNDRQARPDRQGRLDGNGDRRGDQEQGNRRGAGDRDNLDGRGGAEDRWGNPGRDDRRSANPPARDDDTGLDDDAMGLDNNGGDPERKSDRSEIPDGERL